MRKLVVFALALVLTVGSMAAVVVALLDDSDSSSTSESPTRTNPPTTSTTRVEFSGSGSAEFCAADARLNAAIAQQAPTTNDAASLQADFERRVAAVEELARLAPEEIAPDVRTVAGAYEQLSPALAAAGYDMSKVAPADRAASQTPEVTAAGQRLSQYTERICKLGTDG